MDVRSPAPISKDVQMEKESDFWMFFNTRIIAFNRQLSRMSEDELNKLSFVKTLRPKVECILYVDGFLGKEKGDILMSKPMKTNRLKLGTDSICEVISRGTNWREVTFKFLTNGQVKEIPKAYYPHEETKKRKASLQLLDEEVQACSPEVQTKLYSTKRVQQVFSVLVKKLCSELIDAITEESKLCFDKYTMQYQLAKYCVECLKAAFCIDVAVAESSSSSLNKLIVENLSSFLALFNTLGTRKQDHQRAFDTVVLAASFTTCVTQKSFHALKID